MRVLSDSLQAMCTRADGQSNDAASDETFDDHALVFYVNGRRIEERNVDPRTSLAAYLRDTLRLTGTKLGCNEGGCGACVVMLSGVEPQGEALRHYSATACLTPVCAVHGKAITTVEGVGSVASGRLHAVQERLSIGELSASARRYRRLAIVASCRAHGAQCGFCTPGFVMAMYTLLRNKPRPTHADVDEALQGNLCRCTGYRPILEAYYSFAVRETDGVVEAPRAAAASGLCGLGANCCRNGAAAAPNAPCSNDGGCCKSEKTRANKLSNLADCAPYNPDAELIFPPELQLRNFHRRSFTMSSGERVWYAPTTLAQLMRLKRRHPKSRIIGGNSELAIESKFGFIDLSVALNPKQIAELRECCVDRKAEAIYCGAGLSLDEMKDRLAAAIAELPPYETKIMRAVCAMLHNFGGRHMRNMATAAGNIVTASPISDLNPIWMASRAQLLLASDARGERRAPIDENFFVAYRRTTIAADEVAKGVFIPLTRRGQHFRAYKQAQRRDDDIAVVTCAFFAHVDSRDKTIVELRAAFGGM